MSNANPTAAMPQMSHCCAVSFGAIASSAIPAPFEEHRRTLTQPTVGQPPSPTFFESSPERLLHFYDSCRGVFVDLVPGRI